MKRLANLRALWGVSAFGLVITICSAIATAQDGAGSGAAPPTSRSFFQMFFLTGDLLGTAIVWVLFVLSLVCTGYAIFLALKYRRGQLIPEQTFEQVQIMLENKQYREAIDFADADESYLGKVISGALNEASNGYSAMERAVEEASDVEATRILRPLEYLNVVGNIAPMMGLFGTVYGMIVAFAKLVQAGGRPDPAELAGGISTALVTTFWGLVVAIPALAAYSLIRNKIDAHCAEGTVIAEDLIRPFKPSGKKKSGSGSKSAAPKPQ